MKRCDSDETVGEYIRRLHGRVNYALSVEPENVELQEYREWLKGFVISEEGNALYYE